MIKEVVIFFIILLNCELIMAYSNFSPQPFRMVPVSIGVKTENKIRKL